MIAIEPGRTACHRNLLCSGATTANLLFRASYARDGPVWTNTSRQGVSMVEIVRMQSYWFEDV
jgi:hypothetical protein